MQEKTYTINDPRQSHTPGARVISNGNGDAVPRIRKWKNPAVAFSLSLIVPGAGQFYNRQWKAGILFLLPIIILCSFIGITVIYWEYLKTLYESFSVSRSGLLLTFITFYFSGLVIWYINAWLAYFKTVKNNSTPFTGIRTRWFPVVCSLLIPGWGQCLNGQTKKGLFFQVFALAGMAAFPVILIIFRVWQSLEPSQARLALEWILTICIILVPFILSMWLFSIYDAAMVGMSNQKGDPLRKKIGYSISRLRHRILTYGWKNAIMPSIKRFAMFILLLTFCLTISYYYFPESFYLSSLQHFETYLAQKEMTLIPLLINQILY